MPLRCDALALSCSAAPMTVLVPAIGLSWLLALYPAAALAQTPTGESRPSPPTQLAPPQPDRDAGAVEPDPAAAQDAPRVDYSSPYEAFDAAAYSQALEGFVDRQTRQPDDPEWSLNVGAAHYKMSDFEAADSQFYRAAAIGDDEVRAQALYNLGNSAYRQGKLGDAIDFFMASLEANPDDLDAKFNLEFVREEMKRQQQNQGQDPNQQNEDQEQQEQQEQAGPGQQPENSGGQSDGEQPDDQQQDRRSQGQDQPQDQDQQGGEGAQDTDRDGLGDDLERGGENPTDPRNPDSDADGLPDGQEDRNRNGRVDPGETDPNLQDSDGDGIPDASDTPPEGDGSGRGSQGGPRELPPGMTPEEAERYLQALEEGRPDPQRRGQRGRRSRQAKDW